MDLTNDFRSKILTKIEEMLYEDDETMCELAHYIGIEEGKANVFCDNCQCEYENITFKTKTCEWKCPGCGRKHEN